MFWLDALMKDFNITTRYELSKKTGIGQTSLSAIYNRKTPTGKVKFDMIRALASSFELSLDELNAKLVEYEKNEA